MDLNQFDYVLPEQLIAQYPLPERAQSRLLAVPRSPGLIAEYRFKAIKKLLSPGDLLVVNDTRVLPSRIIARKPSGGKIEIMLERIISGCNALVLLRANKSVKPGQLILIGDVSARVIAHRQPFYEIAVENDIAMMFLRYGMVPLPPYIRRPVSKEDDRRYQTVYASNPGAVAAPTAGLHFDQTLIDQLAERGINWCSITLHVGAGTFQPVRCKTIYEHKMHEEYFRIDQSVCDAINETKDRNNNVVAVGTTVVRALESAALKGHIEPCDKSTELFITPGFQFRVVDQLITNFHLPKSTLLMMVCAFAGYRRVMDAYRIAIEKKFRFFSYGDAMHLEKCP